MVTTHTHIQHGYYTHTHTKHLLHTHITEEVHQIITMFLSLTLVVCFSHQAFCDTNQHGRHVDIVDDKDNLCKQNILSALVNTHDKPPSSSVL